MGWHRSRVTVRPGKSGVPRWSVEPWWKRRRQPRAQQITRSSYSKPTFHTAKKRGRDGTGESGQRRAGGTRSRDGGRLAGGRVRGGVDVVARTYASVAEDPEGFVGGEAERLAVHDEAVVPWTRHGGHRRGAARWGEVGRRRGARARGDDGRPRGRRGREARGGEHARAVVCGACSPDTWRSSERSLGARSFSFALGRLSLIQCAAARPPAGMTTAPPPRAPSR